VLGVGGDGTVTGPTDPALRALKVLEDFTYPAGPAPTEAEIACDEALQVIRAALAAAEAAPDWYDRDAAAFGRAHAAAEAAPLDVERLARALNASVGTEGWLRLTPPNAVDEWRENARIIAREYAALRSPDTETAGEAG
jgi:hypothetical protein